MTTDRNPYDLFGLDLRRLAGLWRLGWREALDWPFFTRLLPAEPVCLQLPEGGERIWPAAGPAAVRARALLLPEEKVLQQSLLLPPLSPAELRQAVLLAVQATTPFGMDATAWGYRPEVAGGQLRVELAMAAKAHVAECIAAASAGDAQGGGAELEVWAGGPPFVVLQGYAEAHRYARTRRRHRQTLALIGAAVFLAGALAASPALQAQRQAQEAQARLDALTQAVAPIVATRDAFGRANLQLQTVTAYAAARPDPVSLLGRLSQLLPDSAHLTRLELRGDTVVLGGLADNAAGLMETLGAQPDFHDLRSPSAIARDRATGRESFAIEFRLGQGAER